LFGETRSVKKWQALAIEPDGRKPSLAAYIPGPMKLRAFYKGKKLTARVRRNGSIRFAGKIYTSPSVAGAAAVKHRDIGDIGET
jgi:hypothetical protein